MKTEGIDIGVTHVASHKNYDVDGNFAASIGEDTVLSL